MFLMYKDLYPLHSVPYQSYRDIFNTKFNITFGYSRSDTCSFCDENTAAVKIFNAKLALPNDASEINKINAAIKNLDVERNGHLKKAESFYDRKRIARQNSRKKISGSYLHGLLE